MQTYTLTLLERELLSLWLREINKENVELVHTHTQPAVTGVEFHPRKLDCFYENAYRYCVSDCTPRRPADSPEADKPLERVESRELLGPKGELVIVHNGREYRLRLTQHGKLILTA